MGEHRPASRCTRGWPSSVAARDRRSRQGRARGATDLWSRTQSVLMQPLAPQPALSNELLDQLALVFARAAVDAYLRGDQHDQEHYQNVHPRDRRIQVATSRDPLEARR